MSRDFRQTMWDAAAEAECRQIIRTAVLEDLDRGYDWTSTALIPGNAEGSAAVVARAGGTIAGLHAAALVVEETDKSLVFEARAKDGDNAAPADTIALLSGPVRSILAVERILLNFVGHLSGIAALTRCYVERVSGTKARIYDTRKTIPGWRRLEKYAVRQGGGNNHRMGLYDAILIKDNHIAFVSRQEGSAVSMDPSRSDLVQVSSLAAAAAVRKARQFLNEAFRNDPRSQMILEVEVDSLEALESVLSEQPDIVLLDNMTPPQLRQAVALRDSTAPTVELEASGGVSLTTVAEIAGTGIDRISVGALTHSAPVLDVALDWLV